MNRSLQTCLAALLLATLLGTSLASANDRPRPFKGQGVGVITELEFLSETQVEGVIEWTGNATHLGKFTRTEFVNADFAAGTVDGFMIFRAANGDELYLTFEGNFIETGEAVGCYTFTGGTGRFADASGTTCFVAQPPAIIELGAPVTVEFEGFIIY